MNKNIFGIILVFGLISTISVFMAIFLWSFNNDYILYNVNLQAEDLQDSGIISQSDLDHIEDAGNDHASLNFHFDEFWLMSYLIMFIGTLLVSYYSREEGLFSFLTTLFFGTMIFLFMLGIITQLTTWLTSELFYKMIPALEGSMPMYDYYMAHIGIISFIHLLICISANRFYFKIKEFTMKSDDMLVDSEIL